MRIKQLTTGSFLIKFEAEDFPSRDLIKEVCDQYGVMIPESYKGKSTNFYVVQTFTQAIKGGNFLFLHMNSIKVGSQTISPHPVKYLLDLKNISLPILNSFVTERMEVAKLFGLNLFEFEVYLFGFLLHLNANDREDTELYKYAETQLFKSYILYPRNTDKKPPTYEELLKASYFAILSRLAGRTSFTIKECLKMWEFLEGIEVDKLIELIRRGRFWTAYHRKNTIFDLDKFCELLDDLKDLDEIPEEWLIEIVGSKN